MQIYLNLYSDNINDRKTIEKFIINKDPVVAVANEKLNSYQTVARILNTADDLSKYIYIADNFNVSEVAAFLLSFRDLNSKNILLTTPAQYQERSEEYARYLIRVLKREELMKTFKYGVHFEDN